MIPTMNRFARLTPAPRARVAARMRVAPIASGALSRVAPGTLSRLLPRALASVALLALAACSPAEPREYAGHGEAVEIDAAARTVTLDHGDIPDLMKGMTMTFAVAPNVDLAALAPGTEVDFRLSDADGGLTVVAIRPVGDAAESGLGAP